MKYLHKFLQHLNESQDISDFSKEELDALWKAWEKRGEKTFAGILPAGSEIDMKRNKLKEVIKSLVNEALNEYEKGDENDKAPSIKEATKDIIDIMVKKLKNEESFKKSELDDVFSKYESTAGKRYKNSVFQDVISGLKTKGYKIKYK